MRWRSKTQRLALTAAIALLFVPTLASAQEATPPARPSPEPAASAIRAWNAPEGSGYGTFYTTVWLYDSDGDAQAAFPQWPAFVNAIGSYAWKDPTWEAIAAPRLGDESAAYQEQVTIDPNSMVLYVFLFVRVDRWIRIYQISTKHARANSARVDEIINDAAKTARNVLSRRPSASTPTTQGGITTGGAFDLLPGPGDVHAGMTLDYAFGEIQGTPIPHR
ncbi:MAG: hypothetical protein ACJ789_10970 [Thermomicrobiales bacterium]